VNKCFIQYCILDIFIPLLNRKLLVHILKFFRITWQQKQQPNNVIFQRNPAVGCNSAISGLLLCGRSKILIHNSGHV
jgi:hypothetical protein